MISFTLALTLSAPSPACPLLDHLCMGAHYTRSAEAATNAESRATYFEAAFSSYLSLYKEGHDPRYLCEARRMLDLAVAAVEDSAENRKYFAPRRRELARLRTTKSPPCAGKPRWRSSETAVAVGSTPAAATTSVASSSRTSPPATAPFRETAASDPGPPLSPIPPDARSAAVATSGPAQATSPGAAAPSPPPASTARTYSRTVPRAAWSGTPADAKHDPLRAGRRLVVAGGVALGAGLALTGVAAYAGHRTLEVRRAAEALAAEVDGFATDEQLAREARLTHDYTQLAPQALGFAVASGATLVVSAILLGVGGRRMARAAARTSLVPVPGGLAFHTRF
jgi:hypothetical protein